MKKIDLTGLRFGELVAMRNRKSDKNNHALWLCECACGNTTTVSSNHLRTGNTKSCGCKKYSGFEKHRLTHGKSNTPAHLAWMRMKTRCLNRNCYAYKNYGGRGITICKRWVHSFENFYADMGDPPSGRSLERKNNNKGYSPKNCIWATRKMQNSNRRTTLYFRVNGERGTLLDLCEEYGMRYTLVYERIHCYGWGIRKALTQPVRTNKK